MLSRAKATPRGEYCCGSTWGSGYNWCLLQMYDVISLHLPDQRLIEVILFPMVLSALHSDDLGGSYDPLKTQYLGARGAGREWLELELIRLIIGDGDAGTRACTLRYTVLSDVTQWTCDRALRKTL